MNTQYRGAILLDLRVGTLLEEEEEEEFRLSVLSLFLSFSLYNRASCWKIRRDAFSLFVQRQI